MRAMWGFRVKIAAHFIHEVRHTAVRMRPDGRLALLYIAQAGYDLQLAIDHFENLLRSWNQFLANATYDG